MRRVNRYRCGKVPYIYDPRRGDPTGNPPGTPVRASPELALSGLWGGQGDFHPAGGRSVDPRLQRLIRSSLRSSAAESPLRSQPTRYPVETWTVGSLRALADLQRAQAAAPASTA